MACAHAQPHAVKVPSSDPGPREGRRSFGLMGGLWSRWAPWEQLPAPKGRMCVHGPGPLDIHGGFLCAGLGRGG